MHLKYFYYVFSLLVNTVFSLRKSVFYGNWKIYPPYSFNICRIPIEKIDRIYYTFLNITTEGCSLADEYVDLLRVGPTNVSNCNSELQNESDELKGNFYQLKELKKKYPKKEIIAVVGGNYQSEPMSLMLGDEVLRRNFVNSCVGLYKEYQYIFDGIDIDYEYPCLENDYYCGFVKRRTSDDKENFYLLIKEFREQLGKNAILTIDISAGYKKIDALDLERIDPLINSYNIMTYDFTSGGNSNYTGHHCQVYANNIDPDKERKELSCYNAGKYLVKNGASKNKINIGIAFYGKGFSLASNSNDKVPFLKAKGIAKDNYFLEGNIDYKDILKYKNENNFFYDEKAQAPYILDYGKEIFISFDNEKSIQAKAGLAIHEDYQGLFAYDLTGDDEKFSLVSSMNIEGNYTFVEPLPIITSITFSNKLSVLFIAIISLLLI